MSEPEIRSVATAQLIVSEADLASAVGIEKGDDFPRVFSTSRLVALMEIAAARLLKPHLREGELSVGVLVNIVHSAPTPLHGTVIATATYMGRDGKAFLMLRFLPISLKTLMPTESSWIQWHGGQKSSGKNWIRRNPASCSKANWHCRLKK